MTKFLRDNIVCAEEFFLAFLENISMMGKEYVLWERMDH